MSPDPTADRFIRWFAPPADPWRAIIVVTLPYWGYLFIQGVILAQWSDALGAVPAAGLVHKPPLARGLTYLILLLLALPIYRLALRIGFPAGRRIPAAFAQLALAFGFGSCFRLASNAAASLLPEGDARFEVLQSHAEMTGVAGWYIDVFPLWVRGTITWTFYYASGLGLIVGLRLMASLQAERLQAGQLRVAWLQARLDALSQRLTPHFLFNTLHTASALIERDPVRARESLANLSELLRTVLRDRPEGHWTLEEELAFVHRYLGLERLRHGERLQVAESIDPTVLGCLVPCFVLQPVVENAIKHGIAAAGLQDTVAIRVTREGRELRLCVENTFGVAPTAAPVGTGDGLRNLRERLAVLHGTDADLGYGALAGSRWQATIVLPIVAGQGAGP